MIPSQDMGGTSNLGHLRALNPEAWAEQVEAVVAEHDGVLDAAAADLGITRRTLNRWLEDESFAGIMRAPVGRPAGSKNKKKGKK